MVQRINRWIALFENAFGIALLFGMVAVVTAQVIFRFVLSKPLSWSQEIATDGLAWVTFLGMAIAQRDRTHVTMDILQGLGPAMRRIAIWIRWVAMALFFLVFGVGGMQLSLLHAKQSSAVTGLPQWVALGIMPLSGLLGLWHLAMQIPQLLKGKEDDAGWH